MRGAYGKPTGTAARVNIGQVIMSIRCKDSNKAVVMEALRRSRYKFPGRQKIIVSKKWGFTALNRAEYEELKANKQVLNDGAYVQVGLSASTWVVFTAPVLTPCRLASYSTSSPRATSSTT
jgi:large subunit ribosomal protein L10e